MYRPMLFVTAVSLIAPIEAGAQRYTTIAVKDSGIILARPGRCSVTMRDTKPGNAVAFDTVEVTVVDTEEEAVITKLPIALELLVDGTVVEAWSPGDSLPHLYVTGARVNERKTIAVRRADTPLPLCVVGPQFVQIVPDSGNSWVILSLIKSISGLVPPNELFELRLKFGGGFPVHDPARSDSAVVHRAKVAAVAQLEATKYAMLDAKQKERLARARSFDDTANVADWRHFAPWYVERGPTRWVRRWPHFSTARVFTMASADLNLSTETDTAGRDTTRQLAIPDGGFSLNYIVSTQPRTDRMLFANGAFKIFNGRNYVGGGFGGMELEDSRLRGTLLTVTYLYGLYRDSISVVAKTTDGKDTTVTKELYRRHNILLEFYVRAPGLNLLDRLRIRGGLMFPFGRVPVGQQRLHPETRITVSVPIVDLIPFR